MYVRFILLEFSYFIYLKLKCINCVYFQLRMYGVLVLRCNNRHVFSSLKSIYIYTCTYFCHSECIVLPFVWGLRGLLTWQMSGLFKHFTSINVIIIIIIIWLFSLTDFASYEPLVERLCVVFTTEWDYQWTIHFCYTQSYSVCELW